MIEDQFISNFALPLMPDLCTKYDWFYNVN